MVTNIMIDCHANFDPHFSVVGEAVFHRIFESLQVGSRLRWGGNIPRGTCAWWHRNVYGVRIKKEVELVEAMVISVRVMLTGTCAEKSELTDSGGNEEFSNSAECQIVDYWSGR
jgi:hypothetical protein